MPGTEPAVPVVSVRDLTRRFGDFTAVNKISFDVSRGEVFGFLGANGAGKTTAIRMLCGLLEPTSGTCNVAGVDVARHPELVKRKIGYMSQRFSLYDDLTVRENIQFYGGIYNLSRSRIREKTVELLQFLNLETQADQLTGELPLGWKQKLALSVALLHDPPIVFLDEPTSGVDPESRRQFWMLIYDLAEAGKTVFVTTHYMDEAEYCHRVCIMTDGSIEEIDRPEALKARYGLETMQELFLRVVREAGA